MVVLFRSLVLAALTAATLQAQVADGAIARIDSVFSAYASTTSPGCIVGVRQNWRDVASRAYGMANLEYNVPLTVGTISESGSVAKQFTAAALALLHLEGKLSLDDDIRKYLPEVPDFGARITIRHLLTHTSGLRDQWAMWGLADRSPGSEVHTMAKVLDLVSRQRQLNFPTGSEHLYSNTGYSLASVIVTRVSGMPFARFTEERLFKPLGMHHTQWRDDYRRIVPGRATAYSREGSVWMQDMPFTMVHGNGGLLSTVGDWLTWNDALDAGLLGKPELTRMLENRGKLNDGRTLAYALGLTISEVRPGIREVSHGGSTAGYRTYLARYPEANRLSVALLCNAGNANAGALARRVANIFLPPAPQVALQAIAPAPEAERTRIPGSYRNSATEEWFIVGAVAAHVRLTGASGDTLIFHQPGEFRTRGGTTYRFEPASGEVQRVTRIDDAGHRAVFEIMRRPELSSAQLAEYAGSYFGPELAHTLRVRADSGHLSLRVATDQGLTLVPLYRDGFRVGTSSSTVRFVRDAGGRIVELRANVGRARNVLFQRVNETR
jgi:CubicO group peptidase (beta-lactamase class C family)